MEQKIKYFPVFLILWVVGFLAWEWWNSYPKVQLKALFLERGLKGEVDLVHHQVVHEYRFAWRLYGACQ
jgi:hypothetical protein